MAAQCKIRKDLIKEKRKLIRDRSRSRARSQTRGTQKTMDGITYAERAKQNKKQGEADLLRIPVKDDNKDIMTIIMSAAVYSHYIEVIVPGSFQSTMDAIYKENGLNPAKFPPQTPTGNIKELYNRLPYLPPLLHWNLAWRNVPVGPCPRRPRGKGGDPPKGTKLPPETKELCVAPEPDEP